MTTIAFIGLGAMGSRMASHLVQAGHQVTVYNRNAERASALVSIGARQASTPKEAAAGSAVIITMLRDDEASREVWLKPETGALEGMTGETVVVESGTVSPGWIEELGPEITNRQGALLDAPVVGTLPQAEGRQLIYLVGGADAALARVRPILEAMSGAIHHVGSLGNGARFKLAVNALFAAQVGLVAELLGFLAATGIQPGDALEILGALPVMSPAAKGAGALMVAQRHAPLFPIELVAKDLRYAQAASDAVHAEVPIVSAVGALFDRADERGLGGKNITGVAELFDAKR